MDKKHLEETIFELYRRTATELPKDVLQALERSQKNEEGNPKKIINQIIENCEISEKNSVPICQDTGIPVFYVEYGEGITQNELKNAIIHSTMKATKEIPLRANAVNSLDGKNSKNNIGISLPIVYFDQRRPGGMKISLLLKGGGSENVGRRYSLPDQSLNAKRDVDGIRKCILDTIYQAQGKGCSPGIVSACVGGSKDSVAFFAKKHLIDKLKKKNPNPELNRLEKRVLKEANSLEIGPMGLGGKTTVLDVKICSLYRHPASYFVEVAYSCWALRRNTVTISSRGSVRYE